MEWQHYRSTRPLQVISPPASPAAGPANHRSAPPSPGPASGAADVPRTAEEAAPRTVLHLRVRLQVTCQCRLTKLSRGRYQKILLLQPHLNLRMLRVLTCESTSRKVSKGQGCGITEREEGAWENASRDGSQKRSMFISALALEKLCSRTLTPTASHLTSFEPLLLLLPPSLAFGGGGVHNRRSVRGSALRDSRLLRSGKRRTCMHAPTALAAVAATERFRQRCTPCRPPSWLSCGTSRTGASTFLLRKLPPPQRVWPLGRRYGLS